MFNAGEQHKVTFSRAAEITVVSLLLMELEQPKLPTARLDAESRGEGYNVVQKGQRNVSLALFNIVFISSKYN